MRGTRPFVPSSPLALAIGSVLGVALPGAVWGGQSTITTPVSGGRDLGTQVSNPGGGNIYDVHSGRTRGQVDFNSFGRFEVANGDTVNLHLSNGASTVVNLVWDARALIDGTLNSLKDGAVGGRVVFADTHGLLVGSSGVLNVGSLAVATPTTGFMSQLASSNGATVDAATANLLSGAIPLSDGAVGIHGRINARDDVRIQARALDVTGTVWVAGGSGADALQSAVAVNTGAGGGMRVVNDGGNILLVASDDLSVSGTLHADGGDIVLQAEDQVRLSGGAVVNTRDLADGAGDLATAASEGSSGAVRMAGRDIAVASGAAVDAHATGVHAAGDIVIEASDRVQVQTGLAEARSRVSIDGHLRGHDITVSATSVADVDWVDPNASLATMAGTALVDFAQQAGTALGGAIGFMAADTRAEVALGANAVLDARGDIDMQALTRQSIKTTVTGLRGDDQIQSVLGLGALYAGIDTVASAHVADGAAITADGTLDVSARTDNTLDVSVTSFAADGTAAAMTLALSDVDVSADARIGGGAMLQVGRLGVSALNESNLSTSATAHADADGAVGLAAAISLQDVNANAHLARDVTTPGPVMVEAASLATRNATTALVLAPPSGTSIPSSSAGGSADGGNAVAGLLGKGFHALSGKLGEQDAEADSQEPAPPPFRLGSAMTYTSGSHAAAARIDDRVRVRAGGDVTVHADVVDAGIAVLARSAIDAKGENPDEPGSPYSLSAGVALTDLRHDAVAEVGAGADLEAARIGVGANVSLPMDLSGLQAAVPDFSSFGALMTSLSAAKGMVKKPWELFTSYVGASSKADDAAIGGTINHFRVTNRSHAWIGEGARLSSTAAAGTAPAWSSTLAGDSRSADWAQSIAVRADTDSRSLHSAGELGLGMPTGVGQGGAAVGGSFNNIVYDTVTAAGIARDAVVTSANGVDVDASTRDTAVSLALMAGGGGSIGINGTLALLDVDSTTHASVSRDARITAAGLGVDAMQDLFVWSVSGALSMSDSLSVGLGVGVHNLQTDTRAYIGDNRADAPDATAVTPVAGVTGTGQVAVDALSVQARSQGMAGAVAVAGAVAKSSAPADPNAKPGMIDRLKTSAQAKTDGLRGQAADRFTNLPLLGGLADKVRGEQGAPPSQQQPSEPKFGITVSGSSSVNLIAQDTRAELDGAHVSGRGGASTTVDVAAINDTTLASASGSAAITLAKADSSKFSAAIGGAVSFSQVDNDTGAGIGASVVDNAREVAVHALSGGEQTNVALGVSVNKSTDQSTAASVVGSFSIGRSSNDTRAWLDGSTLSGGSMGNRFLDIGAYGRTHIGVGAGSLYFGGRGGVGAAFTYADIGDTTSATVDGGAIADYDDVSVRALDAARIVAGAAMAGGGSESNGLSGAVVYNNVDNVTRARIAGGATLDVDGDLLVQARSTAPVRAFEDRLRAVISDPAEGFDYRGGALAVDVDGVDADLANAGNSIIAVAGLVQAGKNNIGLSFVGNQVDNVHVVEIANAQLDVDGAARLDAADSTAILGLSFGVGVASDKFAGMGNATANLIGNRTQVLVGDAGAGPDSTRIDAGSLRATAIDASFIGSLAGNVAIGSKAALGAAVTWNDIANLTSVDVTRSRLDSRGAVTLAADNQATILAGAVAGAVGNNAAISGSFAWSEIGNTTRASLGDSRVAAGGLDVRADSSSDIFTLSGAIAASGTAAVGAAINIASIEDRTEAVIEDVRIAVDDDITVAAAGTGTARSLAVAGVASSNVAAGGSSSNALVDNTIAARVSGLHGLAGDGAGADRLQVTAANRGTAESLAGAISAGSSVAVGGALSVNHVGGETSATLADSVLGVRDQVAVDARSEALVNTVAGTGSASGVGIAGAATTNVITGSTRATLADTALDSSTAGTHVVAIDSNQINSVAGSLGFGSNVGVGAAVAVNVIDRNVDAQVLGGAQNRRYHGRDLLVHAEANNDGALDGGNINTIAAGIGGGGAVGGAASVAVNVISGGVTAEIGQGADVVAEHSIGVLAGNTQGINVFAGSLGIGASAAGIGLGTVVNVMDASTDARVHGSGTRVSALAKAPGGAIAVDAGDLADAGAIAVSDVQAAGDYVSPDLRGNTLAVNGLAVNASTRQHVATLGVSGAVSFNPIAGTSLAAMAGVNVVGGQTRALIDGAQINQHAGLSAGGGQQVDVRASSHSVGANFIAGIAAGAGASGAGAVATNVFEGGTEAGIAGATVGARGAVTVDATSSQNSLVVAAGLAGGLAGGAGTGVVNVFQSSTDAFVRGGAIDAGALTIDAEARNAASLVGGAVAVGAMAVSGTLMVNVSETATRAALDGVDVDTDGDVAVRAHSDTEFQGVAVSGAFAGGNALAGMAQVNVIGNFTEAAISGADIAAGGGVDVDASESLALRAYSGALGVGLSGGAGVGAGANVAVLGSRVRAAVVDSDIDAAGDLDVRAAADRDIEMVAMTAGAGMSAGIGGGAGLLLSGVGSIGDSGSELGTTFAGLADLGAGDKFDAGIVGGSLDAGQLQRLDSASRHDLAGAMGGRADQVVAVVSRSTVNADDVNVSADNQLSSRNLAGGLGVGGLGVGGAFAFTGLYGQTRAGIETSTVEARGDIAVEAGTRDGAGGASARLEAYAGGAGLVGLGAAVAVARVEQDVSAEAGGVLRGQGGNVLVTAADSGSIDVDAVGAAAGAAAVGIVVADARRGSTVEAALLAGSTVNGFNRLLVDASGTGAVSAYGLGAAGGILAAGTGVGVTARDDVEVLAAIGDGAAVDVAGAGVEVRAQARPDVSAEGLGASAAGMVALGAVVVEAGSAADVRAQVGDDVRLAGSGGLRVSATADHAAGRAGVRANSTAGTGGVFLSANAATARAHNSSQVVAETGRNLRLPDGDVSVTARNLTSQQAQALGVAVGGIAVGAVFVDAESDTVTRAALGDGAAHHDVGGAVGQLTVDATGVDRNAARAVAGSGGLIAGNAAVARTRSVADVDATIGNGAGLAVTGDVRVKADHDARYAGQADSTNAAVIGGSGAQVFNDASANVHAGIGADTSVLAGGDIEVRATNRFNSDLATGQTAVQGAAGGVISGSSAGVRTTLQGTTTATVDAGTDLLSGLDPYRALAGDISIVAATVANTSDTASLSTGGAIDVARVSADLQANFDNVVRIGDDAWLSSQGYLNLGTYTRAMHDASALVNTWGLAAVGKADSDVRIHNAQSVDVGSGALLESISNSYVTAGRDATGLLDTLIQGNSVAEGYVRGLIAVPDASASVDVTSNADTRLHGGSAVLGASNVTAGAYTGETLLNASGVGRGYQLGFIPVTQRDSTSNGRGVGQLSVDGQLLAGRYNELDISIDANGVLTQHKGLAVGAERDTAFRPRDFLDQLCTGGNDSDGCKSLAALRNSVAAGPVNAWTLGPMFAAGGDVFLHADRIGGGGAVTAQGAPSIRVVNNSNHYLLLDQIAIPDYEGGRVRFTGVAGSAPSLDISQAPGEARPSVFIHNAWQGSDGPAIFAMENIRNIGGLVHLRNDQGSLGQFGTVSAQQQIVEAPNGIVTFANRNADWFSGSDPQADWRHLMLRPASANDTVAYIANAVYGNTGDLTGRLLYRNALNPTDGGSSIVLFGGCLPHNNNQCSGGPYGGVNFHGVTMPVVPLRSLSKSINTYAENPAITANASSFRGQQIYVRARYIDVNSTIDAGAGTDWSVRVVDSPALQSWLEARDTIGSGRHEIPPQYLATIGADSRQIKAWYDAANGRIVVDNVNASGGGYVYLDGKIVSTTPHGKIKVSSGFGEVRVDSMVDRSVQLQDINVGNGAVGVVEIVDREKGTDANPYVTWYVSRQGQSAVAFDNRLGARNYDDANAFRLDNAGTYNPQAGMRYRWTESGYVRREPSYNERGILTDVGNWYWTDPSGRVVDDGQQWFTSGAGFYRGTVGGPAFQQTITGEFWDVRNQGITYGGCNSRGEGCNYGFPGPGNGTPVQRPSGDYETVWRYQFPTRGQLNLNGSVKADNAIAIDFSGAGQGLIDVDARGDLLLGGRLWNPGGTTQLTATATAAGGAGNIIGTSDTAMITTRELILDAAGGIGIGGRGALQASLTPDGQVVGTSGHAGVALDLHSDAAVHINAGNAGGYGDVSLKASGNITGIAGRSHDISGRNISLTSLYGGIGSTSAPLVLRAQETVGSDNSIAGGRVMATALNDIALRDLAGDFWIDSVVSEAGDVRLHAASGALLDASLRTGADVLSEEQIARIRQNLRLDGSGVGDSIAAFERQVEARYQEYWRLRGVGQLEGGTFVPDARAIALFRGLAEADKGETGLSDTQVRDYIVGRYTALEGFFADNLGAGWASQGEFQQYDAGFSFAVAAGSQQHADLSRNAVWTDAQLRYAINASALEPSGGGVGAAEPTVSGRNVHLQAATAIGRLARDLDIDYVNLQLGNLDSEQALALALANTPGDVLMVGADGEVLTRAQLLALTATDIANGAIASIRIKRTSPLFLQAAGQLDARAGTDAYLQARGDLRVGTFNAGGDARLAASGSIVDVAPGGAAAITVGGDLVLAAGNGSIGAGDGSDMAAQAVAVNVAGRLLSASAGQNVLIRQTAGDLRIGTVFANGLAALAADAGGLHGTLDSITIDAQRVQLAARDDIGRRDAGTANGLDGALQLRIAGSGQLDGVAGGQVWISSPDRALTVGTLQSGGDLDVAVAGGALRAGALVSTGGNVRASSEGDLSIDEVRAASLVRLAATRDLGVGALAAGTGELFAGRDVRLDQATVVGVLDVDAPGTVRLVDAASLDAAAVRIGAGSLAMGEDSRIVARDLIDLQTVGDMVVGALSVVGADPAARLELRAGGRIDGNVTTPVHLSGGSNVVAEVQAGTGIGTVAAPLRVSVGRLDGRSERGDIHLSLPEGGRIGTVVAADGNLTIDADAQLQFGVLAAARALQLRGTDAEGDALSAGREGLGVEMDGALVVARVEAAGGAELRTGGDTTLESVEVRSAFAADAGGDLRIVDAVVGADATLGSGQDTTVGALDVGTSLTAGAGRHLAMDDVSVGGGAALASGGDATVASLAVAGALSAVADAALSIDLAAVDGDAVLRSGSSARLGTAAIAGDLDATAGTGFDAQSLRVGGDAQIRAADMAIVSGDIGGNAALTSLASTTLGRLAVAGALDASAGSELIADDLQVGREAALASGGDTVIDVLSVGGALAAAAGNDLRLGTASIAGDAALGSARDLVVGTLEAGGLLTGEAGRHLLIQQASLAAGAQLASGQDSRLGTLAVDGALLAEAGRDMELGTGRIGGDTRLVAGRDMALEDLASIGQLDADAGRTLRFAHLRTDGDLDATAHAGDIAGGDVEADGQLRLQAAGDVRFDRAAAGIQADVLAGGDVLGGELQARTTDVRVDAGHDIELDSVDAARDVLLSAGNAIRVGSVRAGRDIDARSNSELAFDALEAARDLRLRSQRGNVTGSTLRSGRDMTVFAAGSIRVADATVGNEQSMEAGADVDLGRYRVGGASTVLAANSIRIGDGEARGQQWMSAGGDIGFGRVAGDDDVHMEANGGRIDGALLAAPDAFLAARDRISLDLARIDGRLNLASSDIHANVSQSGTGDGPISMALTGYRDGVARRVTLSVDARDAWIMDRLAAVQAELDTTAAKVDIESGWIEESMRLSTPAALTWMHNQNRELRPVDVQLTEPGMAFSLTQRNNFTFTDAYVVRYGEGFWVDVPNHQASHAWADVNYHAESALRFTFRALQHEAWSYQGLAQHPFSARHHAPASERDPVETIQGAVNTGISN